MIGAKRWDTREGPSMWVPSYYPASCVSQSSALLPWSLIAAVFTSSGIIFIIFTSPLTQGHVLRFRDWGPGECDMWHVIMWWHLSCVLRVGNTSLVTTPMMLVTRHWPVTSVTSSWHQHDRERASAILSCGNNALTQTKLKLCSWCQMSASLLQCHLSQASWAVHQWPFL